MQESYSFNPTKLTRRSIGLLARNSERIVAYVDGSALPLGHGGLGVVLKFGKFTVEVGQQLHSNSSGFTELCAIERALDLVPVSKALLIKSDCQAVVGGLFTKRHLGRSKLDLKRVRAKLGPNTTLKFVEKRNRNSPSYHRAHKLAFRGAKGRPTLKVRWN